MSEQNIYPVQQSVQRVMTDGAKATYSISVNDFTPTATPTDVLTLSGASGKIIRVNYIEITADASAAGMFDFYLYKRLLANTLGTATNPLPVIHDSLDGAASAAIALYSANPSALGSVGPAGTNGIIRSVHYALPAASTTGYPGTPWAEKFGTRNEKQIVLRSGELLAVNFDAQVVPAGFVSHIALSWTEEPA